MFESLDALIDVVLTDGFFRDGNKFHSKAKDSRCGCRDYFLGGEVMKLFVGEVGEVDPHGGFTQHMACIQMSGDARFGTNP